MTDYLDLAKDLTRHHVRTMAQEHWRDGYKPRCRLCFVPCDPRSREYRGTTLCAFCYAEEPPQITMKKELLHGYPKP